MLGGVGTLVHSALNGVDDVVVARATAQVSRDELAPSGAHNLGGTHDEARRAEAALDGHLVDKRPLHRAKTPIRCLQALSGNDCGAVGPYRKVEARVDGTAVNQHGAGAALAHLAAAFDTCEAKPVT